MRGKISLLKKVKCPLLSRMAFFVCSNPGIPSYSKTWTVRIRYFRYPVNEKSSGKDRKKTHRKNLLHLQRLPNYLSTSHRTLKIDGSLYSNLRSRLCILRRDEEVLCALQSLRSGGRNVSSRIDRGGNEERLTLKLVDIFLSHTDEIIKGQLSFREG